jgi:predicted nucleotidyltransferase
MDKDRTALDEIVHILVEIHGCHTVILYGSRARGTANETSDWDVLGVRKTGAPQRVARDFHGAWLDAFVNPESSFAALEPDALKLLHGRVIVDKTGFGAALMKRIVAFEAKGPPPLPQDQEEMLRVWYSKTLARVARDDLEARHRRVWMLFQALEDYFKLRRRWYRGPKESFPWLEKNDPETHEAFARALEPTANLDDLRLLVERVLAT